MPQIPVLFGAKFLMLSDKLVKYYGKLGKKLFFEMRL
jgi:hypothetical protein